MGRVNKECRDARGVRHWETLVRDTRVGLRSLLKAPGFTTIAVLTLALGMGASLAIFSAIDALMLRPLPLEQPDRLAFVVSLRDGSDPFGSGLMEYAAYRDRSHSFQSWGLTIARPMNLVEQGEPERIQGAAIEASYLTTLGVHPVLGRGFTVEEDRAGGPAVALISYGFWQRRFGSDPQILGRRLNLNGRLTTVIGVLPPQFDLPFREEVWTPLQLNVEGLALDLRFTHEYDIVGRLKPGTTLQQADADLKAIAHQLEIEYPSARRGWGVRVISLRRQLLDDVAGRVETSLIALGSAVGFLLFICCANVASLLLARAATREREIAVRRALGADWRAIGRQLFTESSILAVFGGTCGLVVAFALTPIFRALSPIHTVAFSGVLEDIRIDGHALLFVSGLAIVTALLCPLMPLFRVAGSHDLVSTIQQGGQRGGAASSGKSWMAALVIAEVAIAVPLLVGGGLMMRSYQRLQRVDLGFRPERLLTMHMDLQPGKYPQFEKRVTFVKQVLAGVRGLPGVESAGITTNMPLSERSRDTAFSVEGRPQANFNDAPMTAHRLVTPDYLETLGVSLVRGRLLNEQDRASGLGVAVVTEEFARQAWQGEDPLGKHVRRRGPLDTPFPWLTVVGVVRDVKDDRFNFRVNRPVWYLPYEQQPNQLSLDLVVRTSGEPASVASSVREAIRRVDPGQPVSDVVTMRAHVDGVLVTDRFSAVLMGALSLMGLSLACIGLYGVMAYSVSRQTGEIGLRAAMGAGRGQIFGMVFGRGAKLIGAGMAIGCLPAMLGVRFVAGSVYGVSGGDPVMLAGVAALFCCVGLVACYVPARRAMKVDPMVALRHE